MFSQAIEKIQLIDLIFGSRFPRWRRSFHIVHNFIEYFHLAIRFFVIFGILNLFGKHWSPHPPIQAFDIADEVCASLELLRFLTPTCLKNKVPELQ